MLVICLSHAENKVISLKATSDNMRTLCHTIPYNRKQILAHSQQQKHQRMMQNMFKVNNKDNRTPSVKSFWCFYCKFSSVSVADFEQVNGWWVVTKNLGLMLLT